jgi:hypothetical protein
VPVEHISTFFFGRPKPHRMVPDFPRHRTQTPLTYPTAVGTLTHAITESGATPRLADTHSVEEMTMIRNLGTVTVETKGSDSGPEDGGNLQG